MMFRICYQILQTEPKKNGTDADPKRKIPKVVRDHLPQFGGEKNALKKNLTKMKPLLNLTNLKHRPSESYGFLYSKIGNPGIPLKNTKILRTKKRSFTINCHKLPGFGTVILGLNNLPT